MRMRRRVSPLKLAMLGGAFFMLALVLLQRDVGGGDQDPWFQDLSNRKDQVLELVRGAVNNLAFQIPGQPGTPELPAEGNVEQICPSGFYTQTDLKPLFERPEEDPKSKGAGGDAFQEDTLTPEEVKEKEEGMTRHCFNQFASDRISLHRSLGEDTRPPE
ncbi:polypeptide N-acetylgalactosaminyltransferase 6 [Tachysurus ichikawai]